MSPRATIHAQIFPVGPMTTRRHHAQVIVDIGQGGTIVLGLQQAENLLGNLAALRLRKPLSTEEIFAALKVLTGEEPRIMPNATSADFRFRCASMKVLVTDGVVERFVAGEGNDREEAVRNFWQALTVIAPDEFLVVSTALGTGRLGVTWDHERRDWAPLLRKGDHAA